MRPVYKLCLCLTMLLACAVAASAKEVYVFDKSWGSHGTADGQFDGNIGIFIKGDRIYTTDCNSGRVQIFDLDGNFKAKFGSYGQGSGQLYAARQVVVDSLLNLFVVDSENDRVTRFNSAYVPMTAWGSDGAGNLNFKAPWRLAINPTTSMLYVADMLNNRISQWTTGGTFVRTWGSLGTGNGQFNNPDGVAVDASGYVYVTDDGNRRVQKFTGDGTYVSWWAVGPVTLPGYPCAIATAASGHVFVGDGGYNQIRKCTATGTTLVSFGSTGFGAGQFYSIDCIAVDASGRVFVSDGSVQTSRIQRFVRDVLPTAPATVRILPKLPHDSENLVAQVGAATDVDGDPLTYRYVWSVSSNNSVWTKLATRTRVLAAASTSAGSYYKVAARAWDGKAFGPWKESASVRVLAGAPALAISASAAPAHGGNLAVTVTLTGAADVHGTLCNLAGVPVAAISSRALPGGVNNLLLPACSSRGLPLPAGQYLLKLTASTADGAGASTIVPITR